MKSATSQAVSTATSPSSASRRRILGDSHYGAHLGDRSETLDAALIRRGMGWLTAPCKRIGLLRGLAGFFIGRSYDLIVTSQHARGGLSLLLFQAWLGPKFPRLMLTEFITKEGAGLRRLFYRLVLRLFFRPAVRRAMALGLVMTEWEVNHYAAMFGLPASRFRCIHWPLSEGKTTLPPPLGTGGVVSSGRASCDWENLFAAANDRAWPLTIICAKRDLPRVRRLNRGGRARVLCDVPLEEHQKHVESASVYVLSLNDRGMSSGHIRMMHAISAGIPIVATMIKGLEGYCIPGVTAEVVVADEPAALREAIERLLDHPEERERLRRAAFEHTRGDTRERYYAKIAAAANGLLSTSQH